MRTVLEVVAVAAVLVVGVLVGTGSASGAEAERESTHCVVRVLDQLDSGEFVLSDPVCFGSFAEAAFEASGGAVELDSWIGPEDLGATDGAALLSTFTLGVHYDGYSGSGSSISVVGSDCGGGYWNTGSTWANRISSTWNGCYRIKHHDLPSKSGSYASTYGVGAVHNVPSSLDNKAESISYWNG